MGRALISLFVRNTVFANTLMACILIGGALAAVGLVSETYPDLSLDTIKIEMVYRGAGPQEIEQGICQKIEEALDGVAGVKKVWSRSSESVGVVIVELEGVADPRLLLLDIKDRVDRISSFPEAAGRPVVSELIARTKVINIAIYGQAPERSLKQLAKSIREDLLQLEAVSQIEISGTRDEELTIEIPREALLSYGLTIQDVAGIISRSSLEVPAGILRTADEELALRTIGQRYTAAEFEDLVLIARPDGTLVRLGQLATITDGFVQDFNRGRFQGQPAVMLEVFRTPDQSTGEVAAAVEQYVQERNDTLPEQLHLDVWANNALQVDSRIKMLIDNAALGILLVVLILSVFLDFRVSLYVGIGIPIAFAGTLVLMYYLGETINMITLFGLIMATGIVVDDAIVLSDGFAGRLRSGDSAVEAAINGTCEVALPVLTASLTTAITFLPLFFVAGVMGKLIAVLPAVVIAAIVFSTIEAFAILPSHLRLCASNLGPEPAASGLRSAIRQRVDGWIETAIHSLYQPVCSWSLRHRGVLLSVLAGGLMIMLGLVAGRHAPFTLLPEVDSDVISARVRFLQGVPASATAAAVERLEVAAERLEDRLVPRRPGDLVIRKFSIVGEWTGWLDERGSHLCEVMIELMPAEQRQLDSSVIMAAWAEEVGVIDNALSLSFSRVQGGTKDKPLEVHLLSDDPEMLHRAADEGCRRLREFVHVTEIEHDLYPGRREVRVRLKPSAHTLGVTLDAVASQLQTGFFGGEAVRIQRQRDEIGVQVRYPTDQRRSIADIDNVRIRSTTGQHILLNAVAEYDIARGYAEIHRQQGRRRARITANVDERNANTAEVLADFEATFLRTVATQFPGVRYSYGGERAVINESLNSLLRGFTVALIAVYTVLAGVLRSYLQPLIIMVAVPLGLAGAVAGHMVTGYALNMLSIFGMVALSGVVVNDALVLLDQANQAVRRGATVSEAALSTGQLRFRAVFLTTVTTLAGLLPLLLERSTQAQHLIPMAISMTFGLAFATMGTLLVVPMCYVVLNDLSRVTRWMWSGKDANR